MKKLSEQIDLKLGVTPQDIGTADVTGAYYDVSGHCSILARLDTASLTAAETAGIQLLQATAADGTDAKELTTVTSGTAPTGNGVVAAQTEANTDELDSNNSFRYVAVKVTCSEAAKVGSATLALGGKRYS